LRDGTSLAAYLALLRLGFAEPLTLPPMRWALTPPFHPYPGSAAACASSVSEAVCFLLHYPSREARAARAQALPGSLPFGARTFLGNTGKPALSRPSGCTIFRVPTNTLWLKPFKKIQVGRWCGSTRARAPLPTSGDRLMPPSAFTPRPGLPPGHSRTC